MQKRVIEAFNTCNEYFEIIRHQRKHSVLAEPEVLDLIQKNLKGVVLDAGCGEGSLCIWLAKKAKNVKFWGVDISKIGIDMARPSAFDASNVNFIIADLKNLPFEDNFFDLIWSQSVIEHVVGYFYGIKEMHRVLKPRGKLLIRVSNGGRHDVTLLRVFLNYILCRNKVIKLNPTFKLRKDDLQAARRNFEVTEIPSDILLKQLKRLGFVIKYFSTRREVVFKSPEYKKYNIIKRFLIYICMKIPFYPFTHLGPTIIVMGEKQ